MRTTITFKHIDHTEALDELITKKTQKLTRFLEGKINVHWFCSAAEGVHSAELKITGPNCHFEAHAQSDDLYKTIDLALEKVSRQLEKKKDKWKDHRHNTATHNLGLAEPEVAWTDYDEDSFDDVNSIQGDVPSPKVPAPKKKAPAAAKKAPLKKNAPTRMVAKVASKTPTKAAKATKKPAAKKATSTVQGKKKVSSRK